MVYGDGRKGGEVLRIGGERGWPPAPLRSHLAEPFGRKPRFVCKVSSGKGFAGQDLPIKQLRLLGRFCPDLSAECVAAEAARQ